MHILDTDTLSHLHAGHARVVKNLRRLDDPDVATTIVTKIELLRGRFDFVLKAASGAELLKAQYWLTRTEELLAQIIVLPFDEKAVAKVDHLRSMKKLRHIGRADLLIAGIALSQKATLVTRNTRHFQQVTGLTLANWVD